MELELGCKVRSEGIEEEKTKHLDLLTKKPNQQTSHKRTITKDKKEPLL